MDDKISLQNIKDISITINDKHGNSATIVATGDELIERIKSVMYQNLSHALTSGVSELMAVMSLEQVKEHPAIKYIKEQKNRQNIFRPRQGWKNDWYFEIEKEKFEFTTQTEAIYIFAHVEHLNNRLRIKY